MWESSSTRQKHFRFQPDELVAEPKWVVGHHPLVNSIRGWMIVSYMPKWQWLILCCCPIIGRGITNFLQILAILPSSLRCPPDIPVACAPPSAFTPLAWENSRHLATPPLVSPRYSHIPRGGGGEAVNRRGGVFLQWTLIPTNTFFLSTLPLAQKDAIRSYKFWKSWNENYSITGAHYRS